jgi:site-specific DNA recombinase
MAKKVTRIEPVRQSVIQALRPKKRVCAYCRVSTDSTRQHTSYVAQVEYYEKYIGKHDNWEFAGIFADEAKSGTKVECRDEFQRMIKEYENGNIDIIITKSVTRFARNTVDSIEAIRKLKALGVTVYFEKIKADTAQ